jgi:cell division septum initiation protein DivIVA
MTHSAFDQPIHGYSRSEVDEFLAAAALERARLEATIADANARSNRARAALGMHRVMVAMLLEAQREMSQLRSDAEREADRIIAEADEQARAMSGFARESNSVAAMIDLAAAEAAMNGVGAHTREPEPEPVPFTSNGHHDSDDYFEFLRGALADDQPLGPSAG